MLSSPRNTSYNPRMRTGFITVCFLLVALYSPAQQPPSSQSLSIPIKDLPKASLWEPYSFRLHASGGIEPYHWRLVSGALPPAFSLTEAGELTGVPDDTVHAEFTVLVTDSSRPQKQVRKTFTLSTKIPLAALWSHRPIVNGQRIDGSIKVSNNTGREFDLTVIVLAINDIGRATAIGYQHFSFKRDTRDLEIPFGDTLPPGNYAVNVDMVGEEPVSNRIFCARLVTGKQQVTQGP